MAERRTQIQVPDRQDGEPPATADQLQFIRHLVTGMSLRGFRFDYRKLGKWQASAVVDQLIKLRDSGEYDLSRQRRRPGCLVLLLRRVVSLAVLLAVLAGAAAGVYFVVIKANAGSQTGPDSDAGTASADRSEADADTELTDSALFPDMKVRRQPADEADPEPATQPDSPDGTNPQTTPAPPVTTPEPDPALADQLDRLEHLLVQLSQFTRKDYPASVRTDSSAGLRNQLARLPVAMDAIEAADAALAGRIRAVVDAYAVEQIDGPAMRREIDAIRERLQALAADR